MCFLISVVLEARNAVPLKSGLTHTSLVVDMQSDIVDKDAQKLYRLPKEGYTTGFAKATKDACAFWGAVYDFFNIAQCNDAPVRVSVWESHDEKHKNSKVYAEMQLPLHLLLSFFVLFISFFFRSFLLLSDSYLTYRIGTIKLNLVRMFEASEGEGQTVIEQWYKLQPTKEEVSC